MTQPKTNPRETNIQYLKGIGPAKAKLFSVLGITTVEDLLCHFPRSYEDRTELRLVQDLEVDVPACFRATVLRVERPHLLRKGLEVAKAVVADHSARLNITFFNQKYVVEKLERGQEYYFYGTVTGDYLGYSMVNPAVEGVGEAPVSTRRILPIYPLTAGLSNQAVSRAVMQALELFGPPQELLPREVRQNYGILPAREAYQAIHQPESQEQVRQARKRLAFEELFLFSAGIALIRAQRELRLVAPYEHRNLSDFFDCLPFVPTGAQSRAIGEILEDFRRGRAMNRLLQGDVGSGKTVVAAAAAYCAAKNGHQVALMAPTEILAEQHARFFKSLLEPLGIPCILLTGSMTMKKKQEARELLASGAPLVAIGTHALLTRDTVFGNLGLVITDEQHRFGVAQRAALAEKGENAHLLVMSATPIPRTLALILYGDLDVSILDELPPGRQKIDTFLVTEAYRFRLNGFIRQQVAEGHQVYFVCPAVEEGETNSMKAAQVWAETLQQVVFPDLQVALLHGKMKGPQKEAVMAAFSRGEVQILVATTVIEVGVDVPNATVMVIEDAEHFGLSQLHQLRGRVGRGRSKSYCILISDNRAPDTRSRMKALCSTTDGFRIAEEDLRLRGPGDFFGRRQHGLPMFKAAALSQDLELLTMAQVAAKDWIQTHGNDDSNEARIIRQRVRRLFDQGNLSMN